MPSARRSSRGEPHAAFTGGTGERIGVPCVAHDRPRRPVALSEICLHQSTGADGHKLVVKTPATEVLGEFCDEEVITPGVAQ